MTTRHPPRGTTLIESVLAMAILSIGSLGVVALHRQGVRVEDDSRHITRAAALAQDLLTQISLWDYADVRLKNVSVTSATLGDPTYAFEGSAAPVTDKIADHAEAELTAGGLDFGGLPPFSGYERYWNVVKDVGDDGNANGIADGARIAVIVRWQAGSGWRRVVMLGFKKDPTEAQ